MLTKVKVSAKNSTNKNKILIDYSNNNSYQTWCTIKSLLFSPSSSTPASKLKVNGKFTSNSSSKDELFNTYFREIGTKLASNIHPTGKHKFATYLKNRISSSMFLTPTTPFEVNRIISSLKTSKSCGHDNIFSFFLKAASNVLAFPLFYIYNYFFNFGIFPDSLKIAKVLPIFKSSDKYDVSNFRLISLFSSISKILEKLINPEH